MKLKNVVPYLPVEDNYPSSGKLFASMFVTEVGRQSAGATGNAAWHD